MYYVYILKGDKKHYVGYTADLQTRRGEHLKGWTKTTSGMGKISLC
jgi:predicted GIY-YIG superfamily endonuclease